MFNVLVQANSTAWETDQLMRMRRNRFNEYSDSEGDAIRANKPESLKLLEAVPTLLMYERGTTGPNTNIVRYGFLRNIKATPTEIQFTFSEEGRFRLRDVHEFADRFGMDNFVLGHT